MENSDLQPSNLETKVQKWLETEGYPLEFATAAVFRRHGFVVRQGTYVREKGEESVREIDVVAYSHRCNEGLQRVYHVVECKWSRDKPWVVFTGNGDMAPSACIAQTISSLLGSAMLWIQAGLKDLHEMALFATPSRPGFSGRQAFSKGSDLFYDSMKAVTSLSTSLVNDYDSETRNRGVLPNHAVIAFPTIVVDGELFEASFDSSDNSLKLRKAENIRCHWKGAPAWPLHATIDVVSLSSLDAFVAKRRDEVLRLLEIMEETQREIAMCFARRSLDSLQISDGPRGIVGLHRLLREVIDAQKKSEH